ncbi:unnamed protein product [marine sediment metagenome]|uniref:Uncharacterized protein n=1 Tax=marine sediment metagenome TaxID=412755 RepID=X1N0T4_9ZZZZ
MKTYGKARIIFPEIIVIDGKMYKPSVRPFFRDAISTAESIEKQIVLEEIESEDEK